MIVLITLTVGLSLWIVAWALGIKSFDAFLVTALITLFAAGVRIALPFLDRYLKGVPATPGER